MLAGQNYGKTNVSWWRSVSEEEIRATRSDMDETEAYHESNDYQTADSGWSNSHYRHMDKVQAEIDHLKSLL
jgi:hypothetical protein